MSETAWFSARIRLACIIERKGLHRFMDSVYVFRSTDFDEAFRKAIEIGRARERSYTNEAGELVAWKLKEIISLDVIRSDSLDGAEVYSEPVEPTPDDFRSDGVFNPEDSRPTQTI